LRALRDFARKAQNKRFFNNVSHGVISMDAPDLQSMTKRLC
jgi:hypothetical protein